MVHPGVMMAAKSLIHLFREKNPQLLHKRDRVNTHIYIYELHITGLQLVVCFNLINHQ